MSDQATIVFGDSITHGIYGESWYSWCDMLKAELQATEWNIVYNLGIPGDTTVDVLDRFEREIQARDHDIIIFAIGINDTRCIGSTERNQTPLSIFLENIWKLIEKASKYSVRILFVGLTPVCDQMTNKIKTDGLLYFYDRATIEKYDQALRSLLKDKDLPYIPVFDCINPEDLPDGLHPNQVGQNKMLERISIELKSLGWI